MFIVTFEILKHVLFRLFRNTSFSKFLIRVINCHPCCMNWYSRDIISLLHIHIVAKVYNHTLQLWYRCISMEYFPPWVLLKWKHSLKINANALQQIVLLYKQLSVRTHQTDTCESALTCCNCLNALATWWVSLP